MSSILLSTAYLPPINYLSKIISHDIIIIEKHDYFLKQTYRNRAEILTANGKLSLTIPLIKQSEKEIISEKKISYSEDWQKQHWRTITSAYKNSPYFEFFEDDLKSFYQNKYEYLLDYNMKLLNKILDILRIQKNIQFTNQFISHPIDVLDLRNLSDIKTIQSLSTSKYYQVFADKFGFTQNLSCLDALFNIGLDTVLL